MKSPEQVSKMKQSELQSELPKLVTVLAETDRAERSRSSAVTVPVNIDEYRELAALPADKAIERLKAIMKHTDTSASPRDASSPDDAVKMKVKPQRCAPSLSTAATARVAHTADTCQETPERRQHQERTCPQLQDTQKVAATVNTEQKNQPGHRRKAQHMSKHSKALPMISVGASTNGRSNLSIFLKGVEPAEIIGLGLVWECRGISMQTFYLCESCRETLPVSEIRKHMASRAHQYNFILRQHPDFLYWWDEPLLPWMKKNILKGIAKRLSAREQFNKMDAQVILLGPEMCEPVKSAPFSDALKIVKSIKEKKNLTIPHPLVSTPQQQDQQPESRQSPEESLPTKVQPSQGHETDQRSDNGSRQETEKHHVKEMVVDLDGVKQRRVSSPLDVACVSPTAGPVVSPFSLKSPQEEPQSRPPVFHYQSHIPELQVELHSESPSFSVISPKTSQSLSVSPTHDDHPTRKRPAAESIDSLVRSFNSNPQLEDCLPAKRSELQPINFESASESTSVNPATAWTLLPSMDKNTELGCDEEETPIDLDKFDNLMALLRELKSDRNMSHCTSASDNDGATTLCANNSSEGGVERRCDPEPEQITSNVATTRWDSNWGRLEVTKNLTLSTAAPEVVSHDIQLVACNTSSVSHSSLEGSTLTRGNLLFRATDSNAADPGGPQNQIDAQSTCGSQSQPSHISINPGQTLQPPDHTETDSTGIHQLPIKAIVTVRSDRINQRFTGSCNGQDNSKVNRGNLVTHSFSRVATVSPGDASGGSHHSSQMAYFSSEVFGGYTPANPPVYTESSFQYKEYTTGGPHPNQIYPEQDAARFSLQTFGSRLVTPEWVQMGLLQQQQCSSWTSTSPGCWGRHSDQPGHLQRCCSSHNSSFTTADQPERLQNLSEQQQHGDAEHSSGVHLPSSCSLSSVSRQ